MNKIVNPCDYIVLSFLILIHIIHPVSMTAPICVELSGLDKSETLTNFLLSIVYNTNRRRIFSIDFIGTNHFHHLHHHPFT